MIWNIIATFFMLGMVSFGGGYSMIPLIETQAIKHSWLNEGQFTNIIAVSGMAPGPIATNSAALIGFHIKQLAGAAAATLGMILPSFLLIVIISAFFYKVNKNKWVQAAFYGLKPFITGLILYAAIRMVASNEQLQPITWHLIGFMAIFIIALLLLLKTRAHPALIIFVSGVLGMIIF